MRIKLPQKFLMRCASHAVLCKDEIFKAFFIEEYGFKDLVDATSYQRKVYVLNYLLKLHSTLYMS